MATMMEGDVATAPRRRPLWPLALLCLLCFAAGVAATIWLVRRSPLAHEHIAGPPQVVRVPVRVAVPVPTPAPQADDGELEGRISAIEERLADVDQRASAAIGDAGRAEGLLVAVAARRALDGGMPLGYLEGLLRARFGATHAAAVATILSAARQPVTLDSLRSELAAVSPAVTATGSGSGWWNGLRAELASLVIVQRRDTPPAAPAERLARAKQLLDDGHVDGALAEVARLPGREGAAPWIAAARRYVAARAALETIETAALLEPAPATDKSPAPQLPSTAQTSAAGD